MAALSSQRLMFVEREGKGHSTDATWLRHKSCKIFFKNEVTISSTILTMAKNKTFFSSNACMALLYHHIGSTSPSFFTILSMTEQIKSKVSRSLEANWCWRHVEGVCHIWIIKAKRVEPTPWGWIKAPDSARYKASMWKVLTKVEWRGETGERVRTRCSQHLATEPGTNCILNEQMHT